ncbi:MAG: hypothetical protein LBE44_00360 [Microbacterium hominis]|jgi:hypothetical protein|nr:hypothetical protein [Microbacterium hominis]
MSLFARDPRQSVGLLGNGQRVSGKEVRDENVQAAVTIANIVRTSLGPHGLDKMLVDDIGVSLPLPFSTLEPAHAREARFPLHRPSSPDPISAREALWN